MSPNCTGSHSAGLIAVFPKQCYHYRMGFYVYVLAVLGLAVLAGIIYVALSKKSSFGVRIAALAALALMIASVIVCIFMIFGVPVAEVEVQQVMPQMMTQEMPPVSEAEENNGLLFLIVFLVAMFLLVLVLSIREQYRSNKAEKERQAKKQQAGKTTDS